MSKEGVRMDPAKIEAIRSWPVLKNVHDIRSFLGLCSYYMRFIHHFAELAPPLYALRKKGIPFTWGKKESAAFEKLKAKLTTRPVLVLPDLSKSFVVQCDACGHGIGAILMQDEHIVAMRADCCRGPK